MKKKNLSHNRALVGAQFLLELMFLLSIASFYCLKHSFQSARLVFSLLCSIKKKRKKFKGVSKSERVLRET